MPEWFTAFFLIALGAFGLVFGSFANVLIWRVPRGGSVVSPPSHCPRCGHDIRWHDNVPLLSWLVLRGRCRDCGIPIPVRYPLVELTSGLLWVLAGWNWGLSWKTPLAITFFYLLLVLTAIDFDTRRLPTPIVSGIAIAGLLAAAIAQITAADMGPLVGTSVTGLMSLPLVSAAVGFALGAGASMAIAGLYGVLRGRQGLGFGDVRLLGAMGLVLGPFVLLAYALANILGVLGAVPVLIAARRGQREGAAVEPASIPFGPYLAAAGVIVSLWGPAVWAWYLALLGVA